MYIDYKPAGRPLKDGKLYPIVGHELLALDPLNKVHPEEFLCEEGLSINNDNYLNYVFIPCNNMKDREVGLMVFEEEEDRLMYKGTLPYSPSGSFHFVGLAAYRLSKDIIREIEKSQIPLTRLAPRICKVRSGTVMALQLMSQTRMVIATLTRINQKDELNNNIFFGEDSPRYKLDGFRNDSGTYYQLVEAIEVTMGMRGLKNPVKKEAVQVVVEDAPVHESPVTVKETPAEPQVEDIQPEQAEEIAEQAPAPLTERESREIIEAENAACVPVEEEPQGETDRNGYTASLSSQVNTEPGLDAPAEKKHTRVRRQPTAAGPAKLKQMDELIEYLGSPVGDMKPDDINEEIKKIRDLIIVSGRRMANLHATSSIAEKKRMDNLRALLG